MAAGGACEQMLTNITNGLCPTSSFDLALDTFNAGSRHKMGRCVMQK